jgi:hypothetical protein
MTPMRNWLRCVVAGSLLWAPASPGQQKTPIRQLPVDITIDELRLRVEAALGDASAWKSVVSTVRRGVVEIEGVEQPGRVEEVGRAPNLSFTRMLLPGGEESLEGCDGKIAWEKDSEGVRELKGDELRGALYDCEFLQPFALGRTYKVLKLAGKAAQGERVFYMVDAFRSGGEQEVLTIDAKSFLPELVLIQRYIEGKRVAIPIVMSDYRSVGGLKLPHLMHSKIGATKITIRFTSIEHNTKIDNAIFALPK